MVIYYNPLIIIFLNIWTISFLTDGILCFSPLWYHISFPKEFFLNTVYTLQPFTDHFLLWEKKYKLKFAVFPIATSL